MGNKKATELVAFAEKAFNEGWGYVWGAGGEKYTQEIAESLYRIYGSKNGKYDEDYYTKSQMKKWKGCRVADCSGLIQAFRGTDDTANGLYNKCVNKGTFVKATIYPAGYLVFCKGTNGNMNHVGIVVTDGYIIHSTNSEKGVIKEKLSTSTRGWTHYGKAHFVDYDNTPAITTPKSQAEYYIVVKGDTMNEIAAKYKTTLAKLKVLNQEIKDLDVIKIGQKVRVV